MRFILNDFAIPGILRKYLEQNKEIKHNSASLEIFPI